MNKIKKLITLLMLLTMALWSSATIQPAWARGGGGFESGAGVFRGGDGFNGGFNRGLSSRGTGNRSFHSFTPSTGFSGFEGRDLPTTGFNSRTTFRSPHSGTFNRSISARGFNSRDGRMSSDRFGARGFDRDRDRFFDHHRFDRDDRFFVNGFFFNPFFESCFYDPFFDTGVFLNPCYNGVVYGTPYYGYDYSAGPDNYYTYNYYNNPEQAIPNINGNAYGNDRTPASPTQADTYFNDGVTSFKSGDYLSAAVKFDSAEKLAPQDKVLPFAYAQAVFASGKYTEAAAAIREALAKVNPETEGIFYPRGLYSNDAVILRQINNLDKATLLNSGNMSLQLLLGYNWLGMGQLDKAKAALETAGSDQVNGPTAKALLKLVDKLQTSQKETPGTQMPTQTPAPTTVTPKTETPKVETVPPETPPAEAPQVDTSAVEEPIA